jgi:DNA-binding response OmpR family regulator
VRRHSAVRSAVLERFGLQLDLNTRKVSRGGVEIALSAKEFALLELFMMNPEKIISREAMMAHLWDMNFAPKSNVVESFVKFLRQKVDRDFEPPLIHTVRGAGYVFSEKGR